MRKTLLPALGIIALLLVPFATDALGMPSLLSLASRILVYGIAAASLNIILGFGGMVSFGHAAFFGIGGYVVGLLWHHHADQSLLLGLVPGTAQLLITLPLAMLVAALLAALIGALALRTTGVQFLMITLAFAQMIFFLFVSLKTYGGEDGIMVRRPELPFVNLRDRATLYWLVLAITLLWALAVRRLIGSGFGAVLRGLKQNERRMAALGISPYGYKLYAFILSGAGCGLAGALMATLMRFTSPDMLHWTKSGEVMNMVILGGVGSFLGPFLGAAALLSMETFFAAWTEHWQLPLSLVLLAVVLGARGGIVSLLDRLRGARK